MLTIENHKSHLIIGFSGHTLLRYQVVTEAIAPHCDVVNLPPGARAGGQNLALAAPHDHVWHSGLFFSQRYVDGVDFQTPGTGSTRKTAGGICRHTGEITTEARDDGSVAFAHHIAWHKSPQDVWIREERRVSIQPPKDGAYRMDWTMTLTSVNADRVLSSASEHGAASGLGFRCARAMDGGRILNSEGAAELEKAHGQAARWADYSGKLDGCLESDNPYQAGLAILDHPGNPGHPVRWCCMSQPFGFLAADRTFGSPWTLTADNPVILRWAVLVHDGPASRDRIESEYEHFART